MQAIKRILFTLLRVYVGYTWLEAGLHKAGDPNWFGANAGVAISGFFKGVLAKASGDHPAVQGWYASFIDNVAVPNATFFSYLIVLGEILVGIALIVGVFTAFAALMGAVMNLNFLLAGSTSSNPVLFTLEILILWAGVAAGYYGLDYFVRPLLQPYWQRLKDRLGASTQAAA
ncbi:DoxX family membrane protein [Limnochorda pilosa]|uniref:DoxX family protein n=1 Tax=Limnochorda pilosa TaxID=1555112 RepID=A0A0K2SQI7_LIMPI|nr:DoxX family membrane protein [Limnochorda pilosa]BAS29390.1 DoxX family protein [Limnochorda pilosa]